DWTDRPAPHGLEKLATLVAAARADSTPTLLLDAGDALFGSPLVSTWRAGERRSPEPVVAAMNALGYDALAVGNHEFDGGRAALDSAVASARFAFLAANVVDARTGQPAFGTAIVREWNGVRIGVLGLTTPAIPMLMDSSRYAGLLFLDPLEVARREIAALGRVELVFTRSSSLAEWKLARRNASVATVSDSVATDPRMHALVAPYAATTRASLDQVLAQASEPLSAPYGRLGDNPLWRIIHRCQLDFSGADVSLASMFDPTQVIGPGPVRR